MFLALLLAAPAHAEDWPAGATITDAAALHVTPDGLHQMAGLIPSFLPTDPQPVDPMSDSGGWGCFDYAYSLTGAWVGMKATGADIVPAKGELDVVVDLDVWINDASDKFTLWYELFCSDSTCPGYVEPFPVEATIPFTLAVVTGDDGKPRLDATMGDIGLVDGLTHDDIQLECSIDDVETVLNYFGLSFYDIVIGMAEDQLKAKIQEQKPQLEQTIEDALSAAYLDTDVDVGGVALHLEMYPQSVDVSPEGLVIGTQGVATAEPSGCVDAYDPGGSLKTSSDVPAIGDDPTGTQVALLLSDDWPDQALYSLWRGGLLCYELQDDGTLPVPLTTSLLGLVGGEPFKALFPDGDLPIEVKTDPLKAPVVDYAGSHDVTVQAHDLDVDFYAPLDDRIVHALGVGIDADIGVDVAFDGTTGAAAVNVDADQSALTTRITSNELAPGTDDAVLTSFDGLVGQMIGGLLGPALGDLSFALPSASGVGLTSLDFSPTGAQQDWLGGWATIGPVTYTGDGSGCGGGCASGGEALAGWAVMALAALGLRRR